MDIQASIYLKPGTVPRFWKHRPVPYALREAVEEELHRLEREGVLEKLDTSEWGTPVVCVRKKDVSIRLCGDYKVTVNQCMHIDQYPLPRPEDLFNQLSGGSKFSILDLSHAYQQMPLTEESKNYTTITTHKGLFRYTRMPFGIACAPAKFQRAIEQVLQGLNGVGAYMDDLIVTLATPEQHLQNLEAVLCRLVEHGMYKSTQGQV